MKTLFELYYSSCVNESRKCFIYESDVYLSPLSMLSTCICNVDTDKIPRQRRSDSVANSLRVTTVRQLYQSFLISHSNEPQKRLYAE